MMRAPGPSLLPLVLLLATAAPAAEPAPGGRASLRAEDDLCEYRIEFDRARLSEERMRGFLRLAHALAGNWDSELWEAGTIVWTQPAERAAAAVARMEGVLARFDAEMARLRPPPELEPVVRWTREELAFRLWEDRALHRFCHRRDSGALRVPFGALSPAEHCAEQTEQAISRVFGRCEAAALTWGNCMNDAFRARHGAFPQTAWDAFLRAYGVSVRKLTCDEP